MNSPRTTMDGCFGERVAAIASGPGMLSLPMNFEMS